MFRREYTPQGDPIPKSGDIHTDFYPLHLESIDDYLKALHIVSYVLAHIINKEDPSPPWIESRGRTVLM